MANLQYSGVRGYTDYTGKVDKSMDDVMSGNVTSTWRGPIFMEFSEEILEEKLELTLEVCVKNTKQHIKDIDLRETGDLHDSIQYWEPRREGTRLVGSYGVPQEYDGERDEDNMDYALYQEIGFHHTNGQWIQNEYLINGLQRSRGEIRAIWQRGTTSIQTFDQV